MIVCHYTKVHFKPSLKYWPNLKLIQFEFRINLLAGFVRVFVTFILYFVICYPCVLKTHFLFFFLYVGGTLKLISSINFSFLFCNNAESTANIILKNNKLNRVSMKWMFPFSSNVKSIVMGVETTRRHVISNYDQ